MRMAERYLGANYADFLNNLRTLAGNPTLKYMVAGLSEFNVSISAGTMRNWLKGASVPWHNFDYDFARIFELTPQEIVDLREGSKINPYPSLSTSHETDDPIKSIRVKIDKTFEGTEYSRHQKVTLSALLAGAIVMEEIRHVYLEECPEEPDPIAPKTEKALAASVEFLVDKLWELDLVPPEDQTWGGIVKEIVDQE